MPYETFSIPLDTRAFHFQYGTFLRNRQYSMLGVWGILFLVFLIAMYLKFSMKFPLTKEISDGIISSTRYERNDDMGENVSKRTAEVKFFGSKLEIMLCDEGRSVKDAADASGLSISYLTNIIKGRRAPSLTVLRKLANGLGLPFEDIAYLLVVGDGFKSDATGKESFKVWKMNDGRGLSAGALVKVSKDDLIKQYPDYSDCNSKHYIKQYIRDVLYKDALSKPLEPSDEEDNGVNEDNSDLIQDIIVDLKALDRKELEYVKAGVRLYIKYHKD